MLVVAPSPAVGHHRPAVEAWGSSHRAPGGYWSPGERPVPEPPDGEWQIITGSILLPLGVLGTSAAAAGVYVTDTSRCQRLNDGLDAESCAALYTFSWVRVAYSSLMATSGAVILGIGLVRRKRHRQWQSQRMFAVAPWSVKVQSGDMRFGLGFRLRF